MILIGRPKDFYSGFLRRETGSEGTGSDHLVAGRARLLVSGEHPVEIRLAELGDTGADLPGVRDVYPNA